MGDGVKEFFAGLEGRADPEKTAGMNNSYLFEIEGAGTWTVDVRDGAVSVVEGGDTADATISASGYSDLKNRIAIPMLLPQSRINGCGLSVANQYSRSANTSRYR